MKATTGLKQMALPAIGAGVGMFASPKISELNPTLAKYPELTPLFLLVISLLLFSVKKLRGFALGLGVISLVFLSLALYSRVKGGMGVAKEAGGGMPEKVVEEWEVGGEYIPGVIYHR